MLNILSAYRTPAKRNKSPSSSPSSRGFTIVELLIVIVVIGILAAIALVSYSSVQTKAANTKTVDAVKAYTKAMQAYKADKDTFPVATYYPCIGTMQGNKCAKVDGTANTCNGAGSTTGNSAFDALLTPYLGANKPEPSSQAMNCGGSSYAGAFYYSNSDGSTGTIVYYMRGTTNCVAIGGARTYGQYQIDDATICYLSLG